MQNCIEKPVDRCACGVVGIGYTLPAKCIDARSVSFTRVCQPSPLARSAASKSASRRNLTGSLVTACTLPTGRPRRRAAIV